MLKKIITSGALVLSLLINSGCAPMGSSIVIDDASMSNDDPKFLINFSQQPIKVDGSGRFREFYFAKDSDKSPIVIGYDRWVESNNLDYYYSLSHIANNLNFIYLAPIHFSDHEWAKVAQYNNQQEHLTYGYLTRKDNALILVLDRTWDIQRETKKEFDHFIKNRKLAETAQQVIDSKFEHLDAMIEIVY